MVFKPIPCKTRWEGLLLSFWIGLIDILLLYWAMQRATDTVRFALILLVVASVPLLIHLLYRVWSIFTLEYWVDRNAITVCWANVRQRIPLHGMQRMVEGGAEELTKAGWGHWPGPYLRPGRTRQIASLTLLATRPLDQCLLLDTGNTVFALSPSNKDEFLTAVQERFRMGPSTHLTVAREHTALISRVFGESRMGVLLLGAGLLGVLALFGMVMVRFPNLPDMLPFRYSADGLPEAIRSKTALFLLPGIGLSAWLANGLWGMWMANRKQFLGAYMLWGGAIIVQLCSLMALASLLP